MLLLTVASFAFGCADQAEPRVALSLPEDALVDEPVIGLTEPRVTQLLPATSATAAYFAPPALSARVATALVPEGSASVSEVRELLLRVELEGVPDAQTLSLELVAPDGTAYEAREASVGGNALATYQVDFIVPVAGTAIDRANLSGTWQARYLLAGRALSTTRFELTP